MKLLEYQQDLAFELKDKYSDTDATKAAKRMFASAGVKLRQYVSSDTKISLEL